MTGITDALVTFLHQWLSKEMIVFIVSLLPLVELRGSIPVAALLDVQWQWGYIISCIGNIIPTPFILLFIRPAFTYLKKTKLFANLIHKIEKKSMAKSGKIKKYEAFGLFLFVAIPMPGTGAWTGALIAAMLDLRLKYALPAIVAGVLVAGFIMTVLSYGLLGFIH